MHQSDKVGGYHIVHSNQAELPRKIDQGYRFIAYGDDMVSSQRRSARSQASPCNAQPRPYVEIPSVKALIFMKAHSERVPGKNVRVLCGRPLFHWIMDSLKRSSTSMR